ncbi:hypothetical protein WMF37_17515 [Sorangium sp. So ce291]
MPRDGPGLLERGAGVEHHAAHRSALEPEQLRERLDRHRCGAPGVVVQQELRALAGTVSGARYRAYVPSAGGGPGVLPVAAEVHHRGPVHRERTAHVVDARRQHGA